MQHPVLFPFILLDNACSWSVALVNDCCISNQGKERDEWNGYNGDAKATTGLYELLYLDRKIAGLLSVCGI